MRRKQGGTRCAIYLRCSSDDQANGDFTTIDAQREINTAYVRERGWTISGEYIDEGRSGTNLNRPDWKRLLADALAGRLDVVCVTYMSRLGRGNAFVIAEYELEKLGVRVEMVREKFTDDLAGYMGKTMTTMMDGVYPKMVSQWTKTKMVQMLAKGYFTGGTTPFGLRAVPVDNILNKDGEPVKRLIPDEVEAEIVRTAFNLYLDKGTFAAVRKYLLTVTSGRSWVTNTVKYLLTNEVYRGVLSWGDARNENAVETIIDEDVFGQVQKLVGKAAQREATGDGEFAFYLRGRVVCPHCGCPYTQLSVNRSSSKRPKSRIYYYVCSRANKGLSKCPVVRINAEALHFTVLHEMERAVKHRTVMHKAIAASEGWRTADDAQKSVRGQLGKLKQQLEMRIAYFIKAIGDGKYSSAIASALEKTEAELVVVREKLARADCEIATATIKRPTAEQVQQVWHEALELWEELTEAERTELLGTVVRSVEVKEKNRVRLQFSSIAEVPDGMLELTRLRLGALRA